MEWLMAPVAMPSSVDMCSSMFLLLLAARTHQPSAASTYLPVRHFAGCCSKLSRSFYKTIAAASTGVSNSLRRGRRADRLAGRRVPAECSRWRKSPSLFCCRTSSASVCQALLAIFTYVYVNTNVLQVWSHKVSQRSITADIQLIRASNF